MYHNNAQPLKTYLDMLNNDLILKSKGHELSQVLK